MIANQLIALTGPAGAGKSTAADCLVRRHGFFRFSFAQPIKDGLAAMFDLDPIHFGPGLKNQAPPGMPRSARYLMQTLGTEWGRRTVDKDIWIGVLAARIRKWENKARLRRGTSRIVIDDLRFDNEAEWVRRNNGIVVEVSRPGSCRTSHASEAGIDAELVDCILVNNSGPMQLDNRVDGFLSEFGLLDQVEL